MHTRRSQGARGNVSLRLGAAIAGLLLSTQTWAIEIERAKWEAGDDRLVVKVEKAGRNATVVIRSANLGGLLGTFTADREGKLEAEIFDPSPVPCRVLAETANSSDERNVRRAPADCDQGGTPPPPPPGGGDDVSINSTSQSCGDGDPAGFIACQDTPVPEQPLAGTGGHSIVAINDLGMHCGDLDTRISSILPPFQVLLAQVIQKGREPHLLGPSQAEVYYSAASNPNDPILSQPDADTGLTPNGSVYKTNFWDYPIPQGAYDPFYPAGLTPLATTSNQAIGQRPVKHDVGLPVPNVEKLYIDAGGNVQVGGTGNLSIAQQDMPGIAAPYLANDPQHVEEYLKDKPFFVGFPFGYVANDVNWFEGAGIPFAAYDDFGRENAYPLVRVQAKSPAGSVLATVDTVLPISGEASCKNCHADPLDPNFAGSRTSGPTDALEAKGLSIVNSDQDPLLEQEKVPVDVAVEWATDINILRLHDLKHGAKYVDTAKNPADCDITANGGNGGPTCLTNQALVQNKSVVCQVCHYTPALDLAQFGPLAGEPGTLANGRNQLAHQSNSRVMHNHHGQFIDLFPSMPAPLQAADGTITNQAERLAVLEDTCYQCHPGSNVQCLRGAMFNGGMLCNDCHGDMLQVGADFTGPVPGDPSTSAVSPQNWGDFKLSPAYDLGNFYNPNDPQPRVPWANEPGCGSCHTGDATSNLAGGPKVIVNTADLNGNSDGIRLRQAWRTGDPKATPIVPVNTRFAENPIPASFNGFNNPGAGEVGATGAKNPKLYRVSTGHGGVFCEGCHGATHAEWPNRNPNANDNVTANQLQGHAGTIVACSTCHTGDLGNTLDGPHGMHPVGNVSFVDGGHEDMAKQNPAACATCHGDQGQGTVLATAKTDRNLPNEHDSVFVARGTPIDCGLCHENPYTESHD